MIGVHLRFGGNDLDESFSVTYKLEKARDIGNDAPNLTTSPRHRRDEVHYSAAFVYCFTAANNVDNSNCKSQDSFFFSELIRRETSSVWTTVRETRHSLYIA